MRAPVKHTAGALPSPKGWRTIQQWERVQNGCGGKFPARNDHVAHGNLLFLVAVDLRGKAGDAHCDGADREPKEQEGPSTRESLVASQGNRVRLISVNKLIFQ